MTAPQPYVHFPGTAREALTFYQRIFGGELTMNTRSHFGLPDGSPDAIAHGILDGPVSLFGADAEPDQQSFASGGLMFALLGAADEPTLRRWFRELSDGGTVVDDLQARPWGASDGQVRDRYGMLWLIGFEPEEPPQ